MNGDSNNGNLVLSRLHVKMSCFHCSIQVRCSEQDPIRTENENAGLAALCIFWQDNQCNCVHAQCCWEEFLPPLNIVFLKGTCYPLVHFHRENTFLLGGKLYVLHVIWGWRMCLVSCCLYCIHLSKTFCGFLFLAFFFILKSNLYNLGYTSLTKYDSCFELGGIQSSSTLMLSSDTGQINGFTHVCKLGKCIANLEHHFWTEIALASKVSVNSHICLIRICE